MLQGCVLTNPLQFADIAPMESVEAVIDSLGGVTKVAAYLSLQGEVVPLGTVSAWKTRGSVPDRYRGGLIQMAGELGIEGITYESLTLMHANKARASDSILETETVGPRS
jgi:hypothetical protein